MPIFKWDNSLSVNVKALDEQHRKWIDLVNDAHDNISADIDKMKNFIDLIIEYIHFHLKYEENLLLENGYPDFEKHKENHNIFEKKVNEFRERLKSSAYNGLPLEIVRFQITWLIDHIKKNDKEYSSFLNSKGIF
ncbi:MAG: bacteriohemerythrin [Spirochaetota bacterium]|nr:bacteriohemerythrin [Spirochaetota bacterium]